MCEMTVQNCDCKVCYFFSYFSSPGLFAVQRNAYKHVIAAHNVLFFAPTIMFCMIRFLTSKQTKVTSSRCCFCQQILSVCVCEMTRNEGALHQY